MWQLMETCKKIVAEKEKNANHQNGLAVEDAYTILKNKLCDKNSTRSQKMAAMEEWTESSVKQIQELIEKAEIKLEKLVVHCKEKYKKEMEEASKKIPPIKINSSHAQIDYINLMLTGYRQAELEVIDRHKIYEKALIRMALELHQLKTTWRLQMKLKIFEISREFKDGTEAIVVVFGMGHLAKLCKDSETNKDSKFIN